MKRKKILCVITIFIFACIMISSYIRANEYENIDDTKLKLEYNKSGMLKEGEEVRRKYSI